MRFFRSVKFAAKGIQESIKTGRNLRIQIVLGSYVLALAPFFLESRAQWALLLLTVFLVISGEIFNTALEHLTDQTVNVYAPLARAAKDAAAGAVMVCSIAAVAIFVILFAKPDGFIALFEFCKKHFWYPVVLVAAVAPSGWFVFRK